MRSSRQPNSQLNASSTSRSTVKCQRTPPAPPSRRHAAWGSRLLRIRDQPPRPGRRVACRRTTGRPSSSWQAQLQCYGAQGPSHPRWRPLHPLPSLLPCQRTRERQPPGEGDRAPPVGRTNFKHRSHLLEDGHTKFANRSPFTRFEWQPNSVGGYPYSSSDWNSLRNGIYSNLGAELVLRERENATGYGPGMAPHVRPSDLRTDRRCGGTVDLSKWSATTPKSTSLQHLHVLATSERPPAAVPPDHSAPKTRRTLAAGCRQGKSLLDRPASSLHVYTDARRVRSGSIW